jgi:dCMP deaminase
MRISRQEYFMRIAELTALRSTCLSRQVGAVVVKDNRILGVGYNGPPAGYPHCTKCKREVIGEHLDECPALHAEANAIVEALKRDSDLSDSTLYCTTRPCIHCLKLFILTKLSNIVYISDYLSTPVREKLIKENNIKETKYVR